MINSAYQSTRLHHEFFNSCGCSKISTSPLAHFSPIRSFFSVSKHVFDSRILHFYRCRLQKNFKYPSRLLLRTTTENSHVSKFSCFQAQSCHQIKKTSCKYIFFPHNTKPIYLINSDSESTPLHSNFLQNDIRSDKNITFFIDKRKNSQSRIHCQSNNPPFKKISKVLPENSSSNPTLHGLCLTHSPLKKRSKHPFFNHQSPKFHRFHPLRSSWWDWWSNRFNPPPPPPPPDFPIDDSSAEDSDFEDNGPYQNGGTVINTLSLTQRRQLVGGPIDIEDMEDDEEEFQNWKMQREAMEELRTFQREGRDPDASDWEDWLDEETVFEEGVKGWYDPQPEWEGGGVPKPTPTLPERGMRRTVWDFLLRVFDKDSEVEEDLSFEERVFRYTSISTTKFVACLILIPWMFDFLVHDYAMMPFIERYVETTPLVAELLDVRSSQKLEIVEKLKLEKVRIQFESDIGKTPPLSFEEVEEHLLEHAFHLRDEYREENRSAFANIFSDFLAAGVGFSILIFNPTQVAIMKITGIRLLSNISDTAKAFCIILLSDIVFGYHSEEGWETAVEMILEHYGITISHDVIYLFVFSFPVAIDSLFKLWVFKKLTTLSPGTIVTFRTMKRH